MWLCAERLAWLVQSAAAGCLAFLSFFSFRVLTCSAVVSVSFNFMHVCYNVIMTNGRSACGDAAILRGDATWHNAYMVMRPIFPGVLLHGKLPSAEQL